MYCARIQSSLFVIYLLLWKKVEEMYGNQNNSTQIFLLKGDVAAFQREARSFVQHLGDPTVVWNELDVYRAHTTDVAVSLKRAEKDLGDPTAMWNELASLSPDYEDLKSHILMTQNFFLIPACLPPFNVVRRRVMDLDMKATMHESRVYALSHWSIKAKGYKGKRHDLKCEHYVKIGHLGIGHTKDRCWILH
ncbi:hypothetical protein C1H46_044929 [Malus baccata]|uniref:Uncharacterized protein n=1 Tax=Malus baccata TaxID=106549 RepID=A0A540K5N5_MALBA|nr:hypothetical protein C1H46_044929 [Malus baccata]